MRIANAASIVYLFALLQMQGGCSAISNLTADKKPAKLPSVQFTAWLAQPITLPIESDSTLALVMASSEVENARLRTKVIDASLKSGANTQLKSTVSRQFEDGCVVLTRGNSNWYFFDPIQLMELFTGAVVVRDGDKVHTLPFFQCKFVVQQPSSPMVYAERDLDGSIQSKSVDPNTENSSLRFLIPPSSSTAAWNLTLVTRVDGNTIHHLVLPAPIENATAETKTMLSALTLLEVGTNAEKKAAHLNNGDIIEYLTKQQFQRRF